MAAKSTKGKKSTQRKLTAILCADVVGAMLIACNVGEGGAP